MTFVNLCSPGRRMMFVKLTFDCHTGGQVLLLTVPSLFVLRTGDE